ncbi:DUF4843 domain-containing protein [Chitinophaga sp. CB10]|uniref:DUF4843 domain-containing protein n=1 Tax=Chitinophaga sp. CB10 TaxID=1891659 RepID=UPI0025BA76B2|nr:DUF4843 domain-containing protein [Chitinophaga sp. CB10]
MKRYLTILTLLAAIPFVFNACKKSALLTFSASGAVYFNQSAMDSLGLYYKLTDSTMGVYWTSTNIDTVSRMDTVTVNSGGISGSVTEFVLALEVRMMGQVSPADRKFRLKIDTEHSTLPADAYTLNPDDCVLKAGQVRAYVPLKVKRIPELLKRPLYLTVSLEGAGDGLDTSYSARMVNGVRKNVITRTYGIYDNIPAPMWWRIAYGVNLLGPFSTTKVRALADYMGVTLSYLLTANISVSYLDGMAKQFYCYLKARKDAGNPLMDKDDITGVEFPMEAGKNAVNSCLVPVN